MLRLFAAAESLAKILSHFGMDGERPVSRFWSGAELAQVTSQMIHL